jgi:hypothetical protein
MPCMQRKNHCHGRSAHTHNSSTSRLCNRTHSTTTAATAMLLTDALYMHYTYIKGWLTEHITACCDMCCRILDHAHARSNLTLLWTTKLPPQAAFAKCRHSYYLILQISKPVSSCRTWLAFANAHFQTAAATALADDSRVIAVHHNAHRICYQHSNHNGHTFHMRVGN